MGHYMSVLVENGGQAKFPTIESSVIPFVWLKQVVGTPEFVVMYCQGDKPTLEYISKPGERYERQIAQDILSLLGNNDNITLSIELDTGSGKNLYEMFLQILPCKIEFKGHKWSVSHDHKTIRLA